MIKDIMDNIISERKSKNIEDDYGIQNCWNKMIDILSKDIVECIKKAGGRLLNNIDVFDVYMGENISINEKSIAYTLTFKDESRTLNDEEVNIIFRNIIDKVTEKFKAQIRDK